MYDENLDTIGYAATKDNFDVIMDKIDEYIEKGGATKIELMALYTIISIRCVPLEPIIKGVAERTLKIAEEQQEKYNKLLESALEKEISNLKQNIVK
jgi:hypothetical protein